MNFYEYYQPGETLDEPASYLAAKELIANGFQVIPLNKGEKSPANVKDVYKLISNPIHDGNIDFYFKDRDVDIGMILTDEIEFIDVDEKYKPGIVKSFLQALEFGWPELMEKLVIHFTSTGGCHLIYKSEITGGKQALAKIPGRPNPLAIIERISKSNTQYIKIPPSIGYELHQGNPLEIQFITAEERNWLSALAMSFNEVHIPEVKKQEAERENSPWFVFNQRNDWKYIRNELIDRNWKIVSDFDDKIIIRRPGDSSHRSSGYIYKDISILYLHTTSTEFENGKAYSPFGIYCMFYHDNNIAHACRQLASEGIGKNIYEEGQFWKRSKNRIEIKYTELLNWFHSIGYRMYNSSIVQVIDNIVKITDEAAMKRAFLSEVEFEVQDIMYERVSTIFSDKGGLIAMLKELDDNFITDTKDETWLFFRNFAIKITKAGHEPFEYKNLTGYIWDSHIIQRDFYGHIFDGCDAERFVDILGGDKKDQLQKIIGYSISKYKDPLNPRAVILMEDIDAENEGESQGGSGKGLCFQFIKQFRKTADFDGKNFRFSDPFLYQNVDQDTSIIFIDDTEQSFKFKSLFSILTGPLAINKKNKQQIVIPYSKSPKIFITSNFSIGGIDISARRRKYEFPVVKHFGEDLEPYDVFKRQFFSDWDNKEWLRFDNFIAHCCQLYLSESNKKSIGAATVNSSERSLINNTNRDFIEYMDGQLSMNLFDFCPGFLKSKTIVFPDRSVITNGVDIEAYIHNEDNADYYFTVTKQALFEKIHKLSTDKYLTTTKLTKWVRRWAEARGVEVDVSYKRISTSERMYRFVKWDYHFYKNEPKTKPGTGWEPNSEFEGF